MLVTPSTRTVTLYSLELSETDAQACLTDPYTFVDQLVEQLRAAAGASPNGHGQPRAKPGTHQQPVINSKRAGKKSGGRNDYTHSPRPKVECTICHRQVAAFMLSRHMETKHKGEYAPTGD